MLQKTLKGAQIVCLNNVQWLFIHLYTYLVLPQTSWRNTRKNVGEQRIGWKKCSHNVKFCAENFTLACGSSVVAVRFFSFVVGFLYRVSFICRALGWLFLIV